MTIPKTDADSKVKREKDKPSRPALRAMGCRRLLLAACLGLSLICIAPFVLTSPELHRHIDHNIMPPVITPAPASKESEMIAFTCKESGVFHRNRLYIVNSDGSHLRLIGDHPLKRYMNISWSPDGVWILALVENHAFSLWIHPKYEIYRLRFDGLDSRRLTYNYYDETALQWSDDGRSISFVSNNSIHRISVSGDEISRVDHPSVGLPESRGSRIWARSSDNQMFAFSKIFQIFYSTNPDGSDLQELIRMNYTVEGVKWAPNNEQILYYGTSEKLVVYNVKTKEEDLSLNMGLTHRARWSPDGKWIAIVGRTETEDARRGIYLYLLEVATGDVRKVTEDDIAIFSSISWSPDSEWIAFSDNVSSFETEDKYIGRLFKIKRDGRALQQLADMDCWITGLSWSPK